MALVAVASAATAAIFITLAFLSLGFLMSVFGAGIIVILVVIYFVGAVKLTKSIGNGTASIMGSPTFLRRKLSATGSTTGSTTGSSMTKSKTRSTPGNETALRVVTLTRQVAGVMIVNTLIQGSYAVLGSSTVLMPLQILIVDLLMPIGMSAALLLLLRFIRDSFTRVRLRRNSRASRRATASVSPSSASPTMDFSSTSRSGTAEATSGRPMMMVIQPPGGHNPRSW